MLNQRLDQLERNDAAMAHSIATLESAVRIVTIEQGHAKELLTARLMVIEKTIDGGNQQMARLAADILAMAGDVDKSPAGRTLAGQIRGVNAATEELNEKVEKLEAENRALVKWQERVDTFIYLFKWIGATGVVSLAAWIIKGLQAVGSVGP